MTNQTYRIRAPQPFLPSASAIRLTALPHLFTMTARFARTLNDRLMRWYLHRRTLKVLSKLDTHTLKDIGLPGGSGSIHAAAKAQSQRAAANENRRIDAA